MTRGMTIIETLLALALLSTVTIAGTSWLQTVTRVTEQASDASMWRYSASAILDSIGHDLASFDYPREDNDLARVLIKDGELRIVTRRAVIAGSDDQERVYRFYPEHAAIRIFESAITDEADRIPALGETAEFACDLSEDGQLLRVRIVSQAGTELSRDFIVPGVSQ